MAKPLATRRPCIPNMGIAHARPWDSQPGCHPSFSLTAISNRHLVRLDFTRTHAESSSSLFLIVTNQRNCFAGIASRSSCPALLPVHAFLLPVCACFPVQTVPPQCPTAPISNRHLVQLEFAPTRAESSTSLFLIVTKQQDCLAAIGHAVPLRSVSAAQTDVYVTARFARQGGDAEGGARGLRPCKSEDWVSFWEGGGMPTAFHRLGGEVEREVLDH